MAYTRYYPAGWKDFPDITTPISANALNHMEDGIENAISKDGGETISDSLAIQGVGAFLNLSDTSTSGDTYVNFERNGGSVWRHGLFGSSDNYVVRRYVGGVFQANSLSVVNSTGYATFESQIRSGNGSSYIEISGPGGTQTYRRPSASGLWDFNMDVDAGFGASIRFHRNTNTTGGVQVQFFKGDGTASALANVDCKTGTFNGYKGVFSGADSGRLEVKRTDSNNNVSIIYAGTTTVRYLGMRNGNLYWSETGDLALSNAIILNNENVKVTSVSLYSGTASSGSISVGSYVGYDFVQVECRIDGAFWTNLIFRPAQITTGRFYVCSDDAKYITWRWDNATTITIGGSDNSQIRNVVGWNISN